MVNVTFEIGLHVWGGQTEGHWITPIFLIHVAPLRVREFRDKQLRTVTLKTLDNQLKKAFKELLKFFTNIFTVMRFIHEPLAGIIEAALHFFAFFCYAIKELL